MAGLIEQAEPLLVGLFVASAAMLGLMAGLFFAYSVSVVLAFETLPGSTYTRVMQSINEKILNAVFGIAFDGAIVVPVVGTLVVFAGGRWTTMYGQSFLAASRTATTRSREG